MSFVTRFLLRVKNKVVYLTDQYKLRKSRLAFYSKFISPGDLCFDVGANMGNRVSPLLKIGASVVAIEPQKKCIETLKEKFGNRITIIEKGVGEKEAVMDFYISSSHTLSSFSKSWIEKAKNGRFNAEEWSNKEIVPITTLDLVIKEHGLPHFIKIDVEGYEVNVLKGLTQPVNYISFEYMVPEQSSLVVDCIETLKKIETSGYMECNYSIGEGMTWALDKWISADEMIEYVSKPYFIDTGFGDVYVRFRKN